MSKGNKCCINCRYSGTRLGWWYCYAKKNFTQWMAQVGANPRFCEMPDGMPIYNGECGEYEELTRKNYKDGIPWRKYDWS